MQPFGHWRDNSVFSRTWPRARVANGYVQQNGRPEARRESRTETVSSTRRLSVEAWATMCWMNNTSLQASTLGGNQIDSKSLIPLFIYADEHFWGYFDNDTSPVDEEEEPWPLFDIFLYKMFSLMFPSRGDWPEGKLQYEFRKFKRSIPRAGAVILNKEMDMIFLVRGKGQRAIWGFPKGKTLSSETLLETAVREGEEETGIDISGMLTESTPFLEGDISNFDHPLRLYIAVGVDMSEGRNFQPNEEIENAAWVFITPQTYKDSLYFPKGSKYYELFKSVCLWIGQNKAKEV